MIVSLIDEASAIVTVVLLFFLAFTKFGEKKLFIQLTIWFALATTLFSVFVIPQNIFSLLGFTSWAAITVILLYTKAKKFVKK